MAGDAYCQFNKHIRPNILIESKPEYEFNIFYFTFYIFN